MSNYFSKLVLSFGHAFDGFRSGLKERNLKIHLFVAICIFSAAIFFQVSSTEWLIVILLIGAVISAELFNTAIEEICNLVTTKHKLQYSATTIPRDLAAAAVLVIAISSALIGLFIFAPKVLTLFV